KLLDLSYIKRLYVCHLMRLHTVLVKQPVRTFLSDIIPIHIEIVPLHLYDYLFQQQSFKREVLLYMLLTGLTTYISYNWCRFRQFYIVMYVGRWEDRRV